jgi:hypothetical protein
MTAGFVIVMVLLAVAVVQTSILLVNDGDGEPTIPSSYVFHRNEEKGSSRNMVSNFAGSTIGKEIGRGKTRDIRDHFYNPQHAPPRHDVSTERSH